MRFIIFRYLTTFCKSNPGCVLYIGQALGAAEGRGIACVGKLRLSNLYPFAVHANAATSKKNAP